jgi:DnaJ-class molecular chaperone
LSNENERKKYERYGKDVFRSIKELTCINKFNPENPIDTRKSPSFKLTIPVSISDIYNGTIIKAKYPKKSACPFCQGTGAKSPKDLKPCGSCGAKGFTLGEAENGYGQKFKSETICPICKGHGKTVIKTCEKCKGAKLQKQM